MFILFYAAAISVLSWFLTWEIGSGHYVLPDCTLPAVEINPHLLSGYLLAVVFSMAALAVVEVYSIIITPPWRANFIGGYLGIRPR